MSHPSPKNTILNIGDRISYETQVTARGTKAINRSASIMLDHLQRAAFLPCARGEGGDAGNPLPATPLFLPSRYRPILVDSRVAFLRIRKCASYWKPSNAEVGPEGLTRRNCSQSTACGSQCGGTHIGERKASIATPLEQELRCRFLNG